MTQNLLAGAASPYLLQHKNNPVHWRPWGPEALAEAKRLGKPILLSVGYAACHWCHVMAHESFEDAATADVMNRLFVNIKVDREERPDVDAVYMAALHALGEQGGWPLTMFLTADAEPFWGGTYFPKESRYGRPAFVDVLQEVARVYREDPDRVANNCRALAGAIRNRAPRGQVQPGRELLDAAADRLLGLIDPVVGGTRGAPKFPNAPLLELLWRAWLRTGRPDYRDAALLTLRNICRGGIYDHLGGGFCRYTVDDRWLVPHFEKMLYDNAQLIPRLLHAWQVTGEMLFRNRIEETVAWLLRDMRVAGGAFASSFDADSEGEEGRYYVWSLAEITEVLDSGDGERFAEAYGVTDGGNWEGVNILNRLGSSDMPDEELAPLRARLLERRGRRVPPGRDDKVLADWNGLTIVALAEAGDALGRPDWVEAARKAYRFIAESAVVDGRLRHALRDGRHSAEGFATDHAALILAALALYRVAPEEVLLSDAEGWAAELDRRFRAPDGSFYLTAHDADPLFGRPEPVLDEAVPSANAMVAAASARLWQVTGRPVHRDRCDAILAVHAGSIAANVYGTAGLLNALDQRLSAVDVVLVGGEAGTAALLAETRRFSGDSVTVYRLAETSRLPAEHPAYGKTAIDGKAAAYVCREGTCSLPVTDPAALAPLLTPP